MQKRIQELDKEVEAQARPRPQARRLLTHPGVGPVRALAREVFLGGPSRRGAGTTPSGIPAAIVSYGDFGSSVGL